ncbi:MAG: hypothetical protein EHM93_04070 [Bacteroidales bacterium]|nr:MAG: hypothetical protein EHM93_04070 [Bacteroidales bacterium]
MDILEQLGIVPVDYSVLESLLGGYKSPSNKIANLEREGKIVRLKKGLFVISPNVSRHLLSNELIANHIYGPSYISFESALRYYGIIPEHVFTIRSVTLKRSRNFSNSIANYEYTAATSTYYPIGIRQGFIDNKYTFLIASPEKAICDMLAFTSRLRLQSLKALHTYLEHDLRLDMSYIKNLDVNIIEQCAMVGKKRKNLNLLYKLVKYECL